ncbi:MAG: ABC transporter permease [Candidatus Omnitrophica bacterium]|nr:ABC transporter permease [Candidatus Omnitrophota bacterium]MBU1926051.1 ABC transporter permease [Candidatus Omnitrophota bacterium]MBU2062927.1 ABC transporter permease [Candidatus Omnitrophota bacterium]
MSNRTNPNRGGYFYRIRTALVRPLTERITNIIRCRRLIIQTGICRFRAKHAGLKLGIWIAVLNPLLVMLAISFVFTHIIQLDIDNFPLFALSGIFPWLFFSNCLLEAAFSITSQQVLLHKFKVPAEALPLIVIFAEFLSFLVGCCIIYPIFLVFNPQIIVLLPVLLLVLAAFIIFLFGLGLALATLNVISPDIGQSLGIFIMFWFWVTPVFYSLDMIPVKFFWLSQLNPMTHFITCFRSLLFYAQLPAGEVFLAIAGCAAGSLVCGAYVFSKWETSMLKRI